MLVRFIHAGTLVGIALPLCQCSTSEESDLLLRDAQPAPVAGPAPIAGSCEPMLPVPLEGAGFPILGTDAATCHGLAHDYDFHPELSNGQFGCEKILSTQLGIFPGDPAFPEVSFEVVTDGKDTYCGCVCPDEGEEVCDPALVEAVEAGTVGEVVEVDAEGVAVYGHGSEICEAWATDTVEVYGEVMSVGQSTCIKVESQAGVAPGSLTWVTWEEDGVLRCGCACDEAPPSDVTQHYIWIANSNFSQVSKIDTDSMVEVARYPTDPNDWGNPSRTSVGFSGAAAIANRNGSVVKIHGDPLDCEDTNSNGTIDTSTGPADVLAWNEEECIAWRTEFPSYQSQRPVAWTQGTWNPSTARWEDEKIWTSGTDGATIDVILLDGETGVVEQTVEVPGVVSDYYGLYGAAVDGEGNFWGTQLAQQSLVRVDRQTFAVDVWPMATIGYGMTVDPEGRVWTCHDDVARFDPLTETWATAPVGGSGGCMADTEGRLWLANDPLIAVDRETLGVVQTVDLPEYAHGVGVDFAGRVWAVDMASTAYRVDPDTGQIDSVGGMNFPYTYSDMTGLAVAIAGGG